MFIITREQTIGWLARMHELAKLNPEQHERCIGTLTNYLALQKDTNPMAFNDFMATIGLLVYLEYKEAQLNSINIHDNCDPNSPDEVGPDQGPSVQP